MLVKLSNEFFISKVLYHGTKLKININFLLNIKINNQIKNQYRLLLVLSNETAFV
jgi:hypothetical protein